MSQAKAILLFFVFMFSSTASLADTFNCTPIKASKVTTVGQEQYSPKELIVQIQSDTLALVQERIGGDKTPSVFKNSSAR